MDAGSKIQNLITWHRRVVLLRNVSRERNRVPYTKRQVTVPRSSLPLWLCGGSRRQPSQKRPSRQYVRDEGRPLYVLAYASGKNKNTRRTYLPWPTVSTPETRESAIYAKNTKAVERERKARRVCSVPNACLRSSNGISGQDIFFSFYRGKTQQFCFPLAPNRRRFFLSATLLAKSRPNLKPVAKVRF